MKNSAFFHDRLRLYSFAVFAVMAVFHAWQGVESGWNIKPLIRLVFSVLYLIGIFFIGRCCIIPLFIAYALVLAQFITFQNYTPFVILILAGILEPKKDRVLIALYMVDVAVGFIRQDVAPTNIFIHAVNCFIFYYAIKTILRARFTPEPLDLKPEEEIILEELRAGKQQKEITAYSQNTITKHLRDARERNKTPTTEELLIKYIKSKII